MQLDPIERRMLAPLPYQLRPEWFPRHIWDNLEFRVNDANRRAEFYDRRNGKVYSYITEAELGTPYTELDLRPLFVSRLRTKYFTVYHPERLYC